MATFIDGIIEQTGVVLSEDTKNVLTEAFETAVKEKADQTVKLEVENALRRLDEQHALQLDDLLEKVDEIHSQKLLHVYNEMDNDHCKKLLMLKEKYENIIENESSEFQGFLIEQISNYLDKFIYSTIPVSQIKEAVENVKSRKIVSKIKELVSLDDKFISETITNSVREGKTVINELKEKLNESLKSNIRLNQECKHAQALLVLEQKSNGFAKSKKDYVMRILKDKDPDYIVEHFDKVLELFDENEAKDIKMLNEQARTETVSHNVKVPSSSRKTIINESSNDEIGVLLDNLKRVDPASRFELQKQNNRGK